MTSILICFMIGLQLAALYSFRELARKVGEPKVKVEKVEEIKPFVANTNPNATSGYVQAQEGSMIIEPKSPQRIAFEEEEELRKMNLGPR